MCRSPLIQRYGSFLYIPSVLETSLKYNTFTDSLVNTRVNTFLPATQLPKIPYYQYFHIINLFVRRCFTK